MTAAGLSWPVRESGERLGRHAFLETLVARNVDVVFHLPGTQTLALLALMAGDPRVRPIFVRHELTAAFAAVGYARLTGRPGVCMSVPGPGALNMLPGVAAAFADGIPLVAVTPQVPAELRGRGAVHDSDLAGIFRATVRAQVHAERAEDLGPALAEALDTAVRPPVGPVQLLFPQGLLNGRVAGGELGAPVPPSDDLPADFDRVVAVLRDARRPVLYAGSRLLLLHAERELVALAEALGAPVFADEDARGLIPEDHPLALGSTSVRGADDVLGAADVCLAIGTAFSEWSTRTWTSPVPARLIHLHDAPDVLGRSYHAEVALRTPLRHALVELAARVAGWEHRRADPEWGGVAVRAARSRGAGAAQADLAADPATPAGRLHPRDVVAVLRETLPRDAVLVSDGSAGAMWVSESYPVLAPGGLVQSEVSREIGSALAMGIGCALGAPERVHVVVSGDGGFLYQVGELSSLVQNGIKLVVVVFEDGYYNADRLFQEHLYGGRGSDSAIVNPDFPQLMRSFGLTGLRARSGDELRAALRSALEAASTTLIAVAVDPAPVPTRLRGRFDDWRRRMASDRQGSTTA